MDRIEDIKLRHAQREVCSTTATKNASSQGKALVDDRQAVKAVLLNRQDIQEVQSGKGSLLKLSANTGANCSNRKGNIELYVDISLIIKFNLLKTSVHCRGYRFVII